MYIQCMSGKLYIQGQSRSVQVTTVQGMHRVCEGQGGYPGIVGECPANYGTWDTHTHRCVLECPSDIHVHVRYSAHAVSGKSNTVTQTSYGLSMGLLDMKDFQCPCRLGVLTVQLHSKLRLPLFPI